MFHISLLLKYVHSGNRHTIALPIALDGEWEIESIVRHCINHKSNIHKFLVRFAGFDFSGSIWLDKSELKNALDLLRAYK